MYDRVYKQIDILPFKAFQFWIKFEKSGLNKDQDVMNIEQKLELKVYSIPFFRSFFFSYLIYNLRSLLSETLFYIYTLLNTILNLSLSLRRGKELLIVNFRYKIMLYNQVD